MTLYLITFALALLSALFVANLILDWAEGRRA